ncbi:hypothetical protein QTN47_17920 [Danxiaibacter flavus]|uniref:D-glucuronyl C5-epimerase C-terminal domain-containing protein n=1 Tax=Danxiaibacter flavus TaxID=3049108 RepID=A0ABV3ZHR2_9BACT|nr:hypothetical protein QNM32_17930 [Chitinophagaceae bacterium DXS]
MIQRKYLTRFVAVLAMLLLYACVYSQKRTNDSVLITQLLSEIQGMQSTETSNDFYTGSFPTYRHFAGFPPNTKPDYGIFYTGTTCFTLQTISKYLSSTQQQIATTILQNAEKAYPYFQNKDGKPIYFFWPTGKQIMPNTWLVKNMTSLISTAEDADDTVIILMSMLQQNDSINRLAKAIIDSFANTNLRSNKSTYKKYSDVAAYNTYLGKNMHSDFDLCVHANVLYFTYANNIPLTKYDTATIELIASILKNNEHISDGAYVAPYYVRRPVILYHLARLIGAFNIPQLSTYKDTLIQQIKDELEYCEIPMDKVILHTSLLRLGEKTDSLDIQNINDITRQDDKFIFYQARAGSQMKRPFKRMFLNNGMLNYYFYCTAYNKALLLEYLCLRGK